MASRQHLPFHRPWQIIDGVTDRRFIVTTKHRMEIASVWDEDDARLFVAAPEMIEALCAIDAAAQGIEAQLAAGEEAPDDRTLWSAICAARAVLKSARGDT